MSAGSPGINRCNGLQRRCVRCGRIVEGRLGKMFCSDRCRMQTWMEQHPRQPQLPFEPPAVPSTNPAEVERDRLRSQRERIYLRLLQGPATNLELNEIAHRYSARIHELKKELPEGWKIPRPRKIKPGVMEYRLLRRNR